MIVVFSLLLGVLLAVGLYAIATGAEPLPFLLAAAVPLVGLQIARRRARGAPVFQIGADARSARRRDD